MFIFTAKLNKRKIAVTLAAVAVCVLSLVITASSRQASAAAVVSPKGVRTAQDRAAYLRSWGWEVPEEAAQVEELTLPETFGPEYSEYLSLQTSQGFDLAKYAGKRVRRYTYQLLNYPTGEQGVVAHLLVCKNTVVGGEVMGEGFLQGLALPG